MFELSHVFFLIVCLRATSSMHSSRFASRRNAHDTEEYTFDNPDDGLQIAVNDVNGGIEQSHQELPHSRLARSVERGKEANPSSSIVQVGFFPIRCTSLRKIYRRRYRLPHLSSCSSLDRSAIRKEQRHRDGKYGGRESKGGREDGERFGRRTR